VASIHPGGTEIAYDGIDQNCSGADLTDVDGDGFELAADCNDNDPSVTPETIIPGDINADGFIDLNDVMMVIAISNGEETNTKACLAADVNDDGVIGIQEAIFDMRYLAQ